MVEIEGADTMGPIPLPRQAEGLLGVAGESPAPHSQWWCWAALLKKIMHRRIMAHSSCLFMLIH